jgi:hypothetical protein
MNSDRKQVTALPFFYKKKLQTCRLLDLRENLEHRAGNIWRALQSMRALTRIHWTRCSAASVFVLLYRFCYLFVFKIKNKK